MVLVTELICHMRDIIILLIYQIFPGQYQFCLLTLKVEHEPIRRKLLHGTSIQKWRSYASDEVNLNI